MLTTAKTLFADEEVSVTDGRRPGRMKMPAPIFSNARAGRRMPTRECRVLLVLSLFPDDGIVDIGTAEAMTSPRMDNDTAI